MLNYIFMGSPPFAATILEKLCAELYPPQAVVTQLAKAAGRGQKIHPTAVETFAKSQNLNVFSTLDVNAPSTFEALQTFAPDLILVAAFGQILRKPLLELPKRYCLNVHASLLPQYRGAAPIQRGIWNGDPVTGITIQKMARKLDTGDILLQKQLVILPEETSGELMNRLAVLGGECLVEAVRQIEKGTERFVPQEEALATHAAKIERSDSPIDWKLPAKKIFDQIRALQPWPIAETTLGTDRLKIFKVTVVEGASNLEPGGITTDGKSFLTVLCGDGQALALHEVQLENRKRLATREFLMAYRGTFPFTRVG